MAKVIIIGMNNPLSLDPRHALYPHPPGCAGWNLWKKMADATPDFSKLDYADAFERMNLVRGDWNDGHGVSKAAQLIQDGLGARRVILLGAKVVRCFDVASRSDFKDREHFQWFKPPVNGSRSKWAIMPHPSGRSRSWNDGAVREQARTFFAELVPMAIKAAQGT